jgi:hypothetical protein
MITLEERKQRIADESNKALEFWQSENNSASEEIKEREVNLARMRLDNLDETAIVTLAKDLRMLVDSSNNVDLAKTASGVALNIDDKDKLLELIKSYNYSMGDMFIQKVFNNMGINIAIPTYQELSRLEQNVNQTKSPEAVNELKAAYLLSGNGVNFYDSGYPTVLPSQLSSKYKQLMDNIKSQETEMR